MSNQPPPKSSERNINDVARAILGIKNLPKKLNESLQTIFNKGSGDSKRLFTFQHQVIIQAPKVIGSASDKTQVRVLEGRENAIFNALFIMLLSDTKTTKNIFKAYSDSSIMNKNEHYNILTNINESRFVRYYCLGVSSQGIKRVISLLTSNSFNLFEQKLPLDIFHLSSQHDPLKLVCPMVTEEIPWDEYMDFYKRAESFYKEKRLDEAMQVLQELINKPFTIPIAHLLFDKIRSEQSENQEAFDYLQTFLK
jgi:hypothetical protein